MKFTDKDHRDFYELMLSEHKNDGYHRSLFYLLGMLPDTRQHLNDLYNNRDDEIRFGGLHKAWQTGGSIRVTRLAFNLFNGYDGYDGDKQDEPASLYTPDAIFDSYLSEYFLEACRLRYDYTPQFERHVAYEEPDESEEPEWE